MLLKRDAIRMSHLAKLNSKGQITIPQEVRRHLGLKQGDQLSFEFEDGRSIIKPYRSEKTIFTVSRRTK